jgi:phospholipid N-methyltransferase
MFPSREKMYVNRRELMLNPVAFLAPLLLHPRRVGAVCPSGQPLARRMAALIPDAPGLVVEIGAGTGAVTRAILDRGIGRDRLLVIEYSPFFCRLLRDRFPGLTIIQGDAADLASYLPEGTPISAIVSSLPLMSLPESARAGAIAQILSAVRNSGCIIQFTYALWKVSPFLLAGCRSDTRAIILRNLPPARVERFRIDG